MQYTPSICSYCASFVLFLPSPLLLFSSQIFNNSSHASLPYPFLRSQISNQKKKHTKRNEKIYYKEKIKEKVSSKYSRWEIVSNRVGSNARQKKKRMIPHRRLQHHQNKTLTLIRSTKKKSRNKHKEEDEDERNGRREEGGSARERASSRCRGRGRSGARRRCRSTASSSMSSSSSPTSPPHVWKRGAPRTRHVGRKKRKWCWNGSLSSFFFSSCRSLAYLSLERSDWDSRRQLQNAEPNEHLLEASLCLFSSPNLSLLQRKERRRALCDGVDCWGKKGLDGKKWKWNEGEFDLICVMLSSPRRPPAIFFISRAFLSWEATLTRERGETDDRRSGSVGQVTFGAHRWTFYQ